MKKRRIIYVDASTVNQESKVSIYDTGINLTHTLNLIDITNNNIAEKYAVINAILYIIKRDIQNAHILTDNLAASQDKKIIELIKDENITISWIPREINVVADKITKLDATQKEEDFNTLNFFVKNLFKK